MSDSSLQEILKQARIARENLMNDQNLWKIQIQTSDIDDAGTDANIHFRMNYQSNKSKIDSSGNLSREFKSGQINAFCAQNERGELGEDYFAEEIPDGYEPSFMEIFCDLSGKKPGWSIDYVRLMTVEPNDPGKMWIKKEFRPALWFVAGAGGTSEMYDDNLKLSGFSATISFKFYDKVEANEYVGTAVGIPFRF